MQNGDRNSTISSVQLIMPSSGSPIGVTIAGLILWLWLGSLVWLLQLPTDWLLSHWGGGILAVVGRTILQTGLFITAHDGMHGLIWPMRRRWNDRIGRSLLWLYAFLDYDDCHQQHMRHHRCPTQLTDPDFHPDQRLVIWYGHFMWRYLRGGRVIGGVAIVLMLVRLLLPQEFPNLLLFWLLPLILSSWQLFFFGIYWPHRQPSLGVSDRHCARSLAVPIWLSFLLCYHFGYHWEHHEYPHLAWYELPSVKTE
jgi:beta-carotene/zeaxanthin 4-ketolase